MKYLLPLSLILFGCSCTEIQNKKEIENPLAENLELPEVEALSKYQSTKFIPTLENTFNNSKNIIYASTLCLAWQEILDKIDSPLQFCEHEDLTLMSNSKSYQNTLKPSEYSTNVKIQTDPRTGLETISAAAYFQLSLPFDYPLSSYDKSLVFKGDTVKSFGFGEDDPGQILYYENDDQFALKLFPEDRNHEIILIKTSMKDSTSFKTVVKDLQNQITAFQARINAKNRWLSQITHLDQVRIPVIKFNLEHHFHNIIGHRCNFARNPFRITKMYQRNAFILDEKGAEVESEATEEATEEAVAENPTQSKPQPKKLYFDDNFIILLKRKDQKFPYFGMHVSNTDFMILSK